MGGYGGQEHVRARTQALHADVFAFEVGDAADAFPREQFEAADVNSGQQDDRFTGVDCGDEIRGITQAEIHLALRDRLGRGSPRGIDIADLGKTLCPQQLLGDVFRGVAEAALRKADGRRFERSLRG